MWVTTSHRSLKWESDSGYSVESACDHMDAFRGHHQCSRVGSLERRKNFMRSVEKRLSYLVTHPKFDLGIPSLASPTP